MIEELKSKILWIRNNDRQKKEELVRILDEGERLYRLGEYKLALRQLKFCLRHRKMMGDSLVKEVYIYVALSHKKLGKPLKAERMFLRGLMRYKRDERLMHRRGAFHVSESDKEFPIRGRIKHYFVSMPIAIATLKRDYWMKTHHAKKSLSIFRKLVRWYPENSEYLYYYGVSLYLNGKTLQSIRIFDEVIRKNHTFPNIAGVKIYDRVREDCLSTGTLDSGTLVCETIGYSNIQSSENSVMDKDKLEGMCNRIIATENFDQKQNEKKEMSRRYKTLRGIFVRSKAETLIDNFYFSSKISVEYEPYIVGMKDGKITHVMPDFFLPAYNCIHEHIPTAESKRWFEWKKSIFEGNKYNIITTDEFDEEDMEKAIKEKLSRLNPQKDEKN